jgi:hypothetical protein
MCGIKEANFRKDGLAIKNTGHVIFFILSIFEKRLLDVTLFAKKKTI